WNVDPTILAPNRVERPDEAPRRIRYAGRHRGMPVETRAFRTKLDVADALETEMNLRSPVDVATAELPDAGIGGTQVLVLEREVHQAWRADLLLALDDELHAERELTPDCLPGSAGSHPGGSVALVVGHTAGVAAPAANLRRPWIAPPLVAAHRAVPVLMVVAAQHPGGYAGLRGVHDGKACRRDLARLEADAGKHLLDQGSRLGHAEILGSDTRLPEQSLQLGE